MMWRTRGFVSVVMVVAACGGPERDSPFRTSAVDAGPADTGPASVDAGTVVGGSCRADRDCDDRIDCTEDTCVVGGVCEHAAIQTRCPSGQRCFPTEGCATMATRRCAMDAQCDDGVPCTRDVCVAGGMCSSIRDDARCSAGQVCGAMGCIATGRCTGDGECSNGVYCDGDERCVSGVCQPGTRRTCADNDACTGDVCNEVMRRCENPPLNPCGGTVQSGMYRLTPGPTYSCGAGSFGPVSVITLNATATSVEVTGFAVPLRGPAPSMGMFAANGTASQGGCQWAYNLTGNFTMADRFSGVLNVSFPFCDATRGCFSQSLLVAGVRQ
jgi:hypothetical protein